MPMTEADAMTQLKIYVQSDLEPILQDSEWNLLLSKCRLADASGNVYPDVNWTPTYNLYFGASEGWKLKAFKVSHRIPFSSEGQTFQLDKLREAFMANAKEFENRIIVSVRPKTWLSTRYPCPNYINNVLCSCDYCTSSYGGVYGGATGWLF